MADEKWVQVAMTDDLMVVDILLSLHLATDPPPPPPRTVTKTAIAGALKLDWTVRQRRSKSGLKIKGEGIRGSPTTPLSWSGATSVSGGAIEGFEESSRRSKVAVTSETATTITSKKSRKKKTLAELREEENSLLKEWRNLKTELVSLRLTVEKHRTTNESLKRIKLDYEAPQTMNTCMTPITSEEAIYQPSQMEPCCANIPTDLPTYVAHNHLQTLPSNFSNKILEVGCKEAPRVLPDLNLPIEEEASVALLYGTC